MNFKNNYKVKNNNKVFQKKVHISSMSSLKPLKVPTIFKNPEICAFISSHVFSRLFSVFLQFKNCLAIPLVEKTNGMWYPYVNLYID